MIPHFAANRTSWCLRAKIGVRLKFAEAAPDRSTGKVSRGSK
jgi:hypothetical protein